MRYIVENKRSYEIHVPNFGNLMPGKQELDLDEEKVDILKKISNTVVVVKEISIKREYKKRKK